MTNLPEHNAYIESLSKPAISLALLIKRLYKPSWGEWENWQHKFSEDVIDGQSGYELKFEGERLSPATLELAMIAMDLGELLVSEKIFFLQKNYKEKMIYLFQRLKS